MTVDEEKGAVVAEATATSATAPPAAQNMQASMTPAARAEAVHHAPAPVQPSLGRLSVDRTCQFCQHKGPTEVREKFGTCAIIALVVLLVCFWPLFFLPLIMPSCKDKEHICVNCQRRVGLNEASCDTCCKTETR